MGKHTVTPCAVTSHACPGASSSTEMGMIWLRAAIQLLAHMELEPAESCSQADGKKIGTFPPKVFKAHLKERTDSAGSSPADRIRQARALEQITMITIRLALQELFFHNKEAPGSQRLCRRAVVDQDGCGGEWGFGGQS